MAHFRNSCLRNQLFSNDLQNRCSLKFRIIYGKACVLESLNKVAGLKACKEAPIQAFSCEYCEGFKNIFFYRTPPLAAFVVLKNFLGKHQWRRPFVFMPEYLLIFCISILLEKHSSSLAAET